MGPPGSSGVGTIGFRSPILFFAGIGWSLAGGYEPFLDLNVSRDHCWRPGFFGSAFVFFGPWWRSIVHSQAYRLKRRIDAAAGLTVGFLFRDLLLLPKGGAGLVVDINV